MCACERGRGRVYECVCVREGEGGCMNVCMCVCVCERGRGRVYECVCVREREREGV